VLRACLSSPGCNLPDCIGSLEFIPKGNVCHAEWHGFVISCIACNATSWQDVEKEFSETREKYL
jgi:hypothetical protein